MRKILYIFIIVAGCLACKKENPSVYPVLKDIQELSLAEVRIEKTFIVDDPDIQFKEIGSRAGILPDALDWMKCKTSVGKRIGVYSFGTYFSAYIDLGKLSEEDVVMDESNKLCTIHLPAVEIKEWGRDFEVKTEHERVSLYRSPLTPQEKASAKDEASRMLSKEITENTALREELIKHAEEKARIYFGTFLKNRGYQAVIIFTEEKR